MHARVASTGAGPLFSPDGALGQLPGHVDIYVGGFECVGNTLANRFKKAKTDSPGCADPESSSYQTYVASVESIQALAPHFWVLENTRGYHAEATVADLEDNLPDYVVKCFDLDAVNFYSRARRFRHWFCGVRLDKCRLPPSEWAHFLDL